MRRMVKEEELGVLYPEILNAENALLGLQNLKFSGRACPQTALEKAFAYRFTDFGAAF